MKTAIIRCLIPAKPFTGNDTVRSRCDHLNVPLESESPIKPHNAFQHNSSDGSSAAFTLVELLVVIAIIGILIALLLPAVQAAREAGRRLQCANKLKQLTLGVHNYLDGMKAFPAGLAGPYGNLNKVNPGRWSGLIALLPYVEQSALYDRFMSENVYYMNWNAHSITAAEGGKNNPRATQWDALVCPSNSPGGKPDDHPGFTCYRFNYGDNPGRYDSNTDVRGPFGYLTWYSPGAVSDGMSNTLSFSEKAVDDFGADSTNVKTQAATYVDAATGGFSGGYLSDRTRCVASASGKQYKFGSSGISNGFGYKFGWQWCGGHWYHIGFTTTLPPNSPSCYNRAPNYNAMFAATGLHTGGVNVTLLDGSGTFVSETVDCGSGEDSKAFPDPSAASGKSPFGVWGVYGSRNGGESGSQL